MPTMMFSSERRTENAYDGQVQKCGRSGTTFNVIAYVEVDPYTS